MPPLGDISPVRLASVSTKEIPQRAQPGMAFLRPTQ